MAKTAVVILAAGFEEVEAIAPVDFLRRAGVRVTLAGVDSLIVQGSRKIGIRADVLIKDIKELFDAVILPGGMPGSTNLAHSAEVSQFIKKMHAAGKLVAAICAAPAVVLAPLGILDGKKATCYPGSGTGFSGKITCLKDRVVKDGNVITSQGPGSSFEFAWEIAKELVGKETADLVRDKMLIKA